MRDLPAARTDNMCNVSGMSARSSSGSWSGGRGRRAAPNIIDLDRFMRGTVRPPRRSHTENKNMRCKQLVVDAGGVERKIPVVGSMAGGGHAPTSGTPAPPAAPLIKKGPSSTDSGRPPHAKRYSHDSGLSDGSYMQRRHRSHRRLVAGDSSRVVARSPSSNDSLRAFRTVCERALQDQQAQIARVAQLCERMTSRRASPPLSDSSSPRSTDVSSTSRSTKTKDMLRKDKHRTEECKTYKIIMNKLDELNRLFAARARTSPAPPPRRTDHSSASVSVSDKLVATEPALLQMGQLAGAGEARRGAGEARRSTHTVTNTCTLDIAPVPPPLQLHNYSAVASVVECESAAGAGEPRRLFDLDDPIHLYSQAKRLEALAATTRRAPSVTSGAAGGGRSRPSPRAPSRAPSDPDTTFCALCRVCWRSLRQYLATQIFSSPEIGGGR